MIDESWLNPNIAQDQLVTLASVVLALLIILPLVFGALMYVVLGLIARIKDLRHRSHVDREVTDES